MQTGMDLGFSWIYFTEENSWTRSTGHGWAVLLGPQWTGAVWHRGREGVWPTRGATAAMTHRRCQTGRGDEGEARARFTEAQATAERWRDGDGGQRCFSDGEGMRGCARERGKEWGRCGDQRGAMRPIYNAGGRSTGVKNSVMAGSGEYRGRRE
jgi:hypothetical protein